jgi:hypothetical protein
VYYSLSDFGHLTRHIKCVYKKFEDKKCLPCAYFYSDSGDLAKHRKCVRDKVEDKKCLLCAGTEDWNANYLVTPLHDLLD